MARRAKHPKRPTPPDVQFDSSLVATFVNQIMRGGKKSTARGILYDAMDIMGQRARKNPQDVRGGWFGDADTGRGTGTGREQAGPAELL